MRVDDDKMGGGGGWGVYRGIKRADMEILKDCREGRTEYISCR
jgi:hypothetical protein